MKNLDYFMGLSYEMTLVNLAEVDGGGYLLSIPALGKDAVCAWGEDLASAQRNLEEVKRFTFQYLIEHDIEIPEPISVTLAKYSGKISLRMPPILHEELSKRALLEDLSLNSYIVSILKNELKNTSIRKEVASSIEQSVNRALNRFMEPEGHTRPWCHDGTFPNGETLRVVAQSVA